MQINRNILAYFTPIRLFFLLIVVFILVNNIYFYPSNTISYDVFGYYLYLPVTFIAEGNSSEVFEFLREIISTYNNSETLYQTQILPNGDFVLKYTSGWAICYAPFFFIAHIVATYTDFPADGFSQPYQVAIFIGSLFYTLLGIYFLLKVVRYFFNQHLSILLVTLVVLGSNYLLHITMYGQNAMSHNLLFTAYTIIIWLTIKWYRNHKRTTVIFLGITCGLVILTRPTAIVCLLIPLLWPIRGQQNRKALFLQFKKQLLIFTAIIVAIGSIQLIYWKVTTGQLLFLDYGNPAEGLDFLAPHTLDTLFSFRKGWYVYTPLMFIATLGFISLYKKNKPLFVSLFSFFVLNLYLVSSWSCWWYATSFSQRTLIPTMVVMIIPLGYLIQYLWKQQFAVKFILTLLLLAIVALNIFQTIQYYRGVIPGDRMTKAYYFATFGSLIPDDQLKKELLLIDRSNTENINYLDTSEYTHKILYKTSFEDRSGNSSKKTASGNQSFLLNDDVIYSPPFETPYKNITAKAHAFIRITAQVYKTNQEDEHPTLLTTCFNYKGANYKWEKMSLKDVPIKQWNEIEMVYLTPEPRTINDHIKIHFWHRNDSPVYVDDIKVEVFEPQ